MITVFGNGVTMDELRGIEIETPKDAGKRWAPIPHAELVDTVRDEVLSRGWCITGEKFSTARDGADMAGAFGLQVKGWDGASLDGMELAIGFIHSNARRLALQLTVGATVVCCTNGMCSGNILLKRVHDHTTSLVEEVEVAVDQYVAAAKEIPAIAAGLREAELSRAQASEILMQAGREGLVGWAAVGRVDKEYRRPTFTEHGKGTSWALLNAFTYAARKNINPTRQMGTYNQFRSMLPTTYNHIAGAKAGGLTLAS